MSNQDQPILQVGDFVTAEFEGHMMVEGTFEHGGETYRFKGRPERETAMNELRAASAEARPAVKAPITRDRDETGDYLIIHDASPSTGSLVERVAAKQESVPVFGAYSKTNDQEMIYPLERKDEKYHLSAASAPASSLVERVAGVFLSKPFTADDPIGARAAIREVAVAARGQEGQPLTWEHVAQWLEQEADRG